MSSGDMEVRQHYYKLHGDTRRYDFYRRIIDHQSDELFAIVKLSATGIIYSCIAHDAAILDVSFKS